MPSGTIVYSRTIGSSNISLSGRSLNITTGGAFDLPSNTVFFSYSINAVYKSRRPSGASTRSWDVSVAGQHVGSNSRSGTGSYEHNITSQTYTSDWKWNNSGVTLYFSDSASGMQLTNSQTIYVYINYSYTEASISSPTSQKINGSTVHYTVDNPYIGDSIPLDWSSATISNASGTIQYHIYASNSEITSTTSTTTTINSASASSYCVATMMRVTATATVNTIYGQTTLQSSYSNTVYFYYQSITDPRNLTINSSTIGTGKNATLEWSSVSVVGYSEAITYSVYRIDGTTYTLVKSGITTLVTSVTGDSANGILVVIAKTAHSTSGYSNEVTFVYMPYKTVKYYDSTQWIDCLIYYYDGSQWILCDPYYYDGATWISCSST